MRKALGFSFTVRMGSDWLRVREQYIRMCMEQEHALVEALNWQGAKVLRYHRAGLPKCLPYMVEVKGHEWPYLASAMRRAQRHDDPTYRKLVQKLYQRFGDAKRRQADERPNNAGR